MSSNFITKTPLGTRDITPEQMIIREQTFDLVTKIFKKYGACSIDTPVFELKDILTNKYGEDSKLIYDLADQGGEKCALRYDLTVPFARYVAKNKIDQIKRYQIGRVYRRDRPSINKGRYREFYQMDFDIVGQYPSMIPDAECLKVLTEILDSLSIGNYKIKINNRKLLDSIMLISGVPTEKVRTICSSIDKLDKETWITISNEMKSKGLADNIINNLERYVLINGKPYDIINQLQQDILLNTNPIAVEAFTEFQLLFSYLEAFQCLDKFSLDLSLARGLDYYTGIIYEAVLTDNDYVGSIASGGRYDNLIGMFSNKSIPAVGISIGIERIFNILESKQTLYKNSTIAFVASIGNDLLLSRIKISQLLRNTLIPTEFLYELNPKPNKQIDYVLKKSIPFIIWIGEEEEKQGVVKIKIMDLREEKVININNLTTQLKILIQEWETRQEKIDISH